MQKLIAVLFAAMFAAMSFQAVAQDKKPSADECKKDPKLKGSLRSGEEVVLAGSGRRGESPPFFAPVSAACQF